VELTVLKNKFALQYTPSFYWKAMAIPSASKRKQNQYITIQPRIESWKALKPFIESGEIVPSPEAEHLLDELSGSYRELRRKIRKSLRWKQGGKWNLPVPLKSNPYEHQKKAFAFGTELEASGLLMEQGTGKTLSAIALCGWRYQQGQVNRILIVCSKSILPVWKKELEKHANFSYGMSIVTPPGYTEGLSFWVTNYDRVYSGKKEILKWKPDMVILDESHKIKNRSNKRSRALHSIGDKTKYKLILDGTPMGQSPLDVWSIFRFLDPNIFGHSFPKFRERYARMGGFKGYQVMGYKNLRELSEKIHSIGFRVTKKECLEGDGLKPGYSYWG
jgi:SNF2 family DNA or RNA helicase